VPHLELVVKEIADAMAQRLDRGKVATYIPELARIDPKAFGLVAIDAAGNVAAAGDSETPFSIQSISKVFTLTLALARSATGCGAACHRPARARQHVAGKLEKLRVRSL
jgi:glutaminase